MTQLTKNHSLVELLTADINTEVITSDEGSQVSSKYQKPEGFLPLLCVCGHVCLSGWCSGWRLVPVESLVSL